LEKYYIGDSCLCWSLGNKIDSDITLQILNVYQILKEDSSLSELGVLDLVPAYKAMAVHFDPATADIDGIDRRISSCFQEEIDKVEKTGKIPEVKGKTVSIPVKYDGDDLERVAELNKLTVNEVVDIHVNGRYTVALVGFIPHFPYLLGLDSRLETARLESPRTKVPAGAVAIGGAQTGIYPRESPGGWNLIGSADPELLKVIEPGDTVKLEEIK